jgi:inorganic pyrophosphatase/K(+)-stimulated pyrophosphate-energized sodium pump
VLAAIIILLSTAAAIAALVWAHRFFKEMMSYDEGTDLMKEIAQSVRLGAAAYLHQQIKWVTVVFIAIAIVRGLFLGPGRLLRDEDGDVGEQPHRGGGG